MPTLTIRIKRHPDGSSSLTCLRDDGTTTWQRQQGGYALVFPSHDLTHYAVETELGFRRGFYGLVAEGWDLTDFAAPWRRGPIPAEAVEVELVVGFFQMDRRSEAWTVESFAAHAELFVDSRRALRPGLLMPNIPRLSLAQIERVRASRDALFIRWSSIQPGEVLELPFEPGGNHRAQ
ncbi:MAG: hypothetical protein ABIP93_01330 [Gemmatimonadaceae bacterium]